MSLEDDIKKTALIIRKYLPKWNHSNSQSETEKETFRQAVDQLDYTLSEDILWQEFANLIATHVPDNHINLRRNGKNLVPKKIPPYQRKTEENIPLNHEAIKISEKGSWYIGTQEIGSKKIGIITIPFFAYSEEESDNARKEFIKRFFELKKENKWDNIIFDFRGNTGGDASVIHEIAERMSGHNVKYANKTESIIPDASDPNYDIFANKSKEIEMTSHITDDITDRFDKNIYILQDGWNASATEGAIYMLKQLKNVKTIGQNTSGTFQSGATVLLNIAPNVQLTIGTRYTERTDDKGNQIEEKKGMKPDITVEREKAKKKAFSLIKGQSAHLVNKLILLYHLCLKQRNVKNLPFKNTNNQR